MRPSARVLVAAGATACCWLAGPALSEELRYATFHGATHPIVHEGMVGLNARLAAGGVDLSFRLFLQAQLLDATTTLPGLRDGVAESGYIIPVYYLTDLPRHALLADAAGLEADHYVASATLNETILLDCASCREEFARQGTTFLVAAAASPFLLLCTDPVEQPEDLRGLRVRAVTIFAARMTALGATPVGLTLQEVAEGLERGQIDCTVGSIGFYASYGLQGTVRYIVDEPLGGGGVGYPLVMNAESLAALGEDRIAALLAAMPGVVADVARGYAQQDESIRAAAVADGVVFARPEALLAALPASNPGLPYLLDWGRRLGVADAAEVIATFEENLVKWHAIIAEIGHDHNRYAQALWEEIYSKVQVP